VIWSAEFASEWKAREQSPSTAPTKGMRRFPPRLGSVSQTHAMRNACPSSHHAGVVIVQVVTSTAAVL
jgi:hypothetical protein